MTKKLLIATALAGTMLSSCKKWIDDAYINPNQPTLAAVKSSEVLPSVHANMARAIQYDSRYLGNYTQMWARTSAADTWDRHGYVSGSDAAGELWRIHYWNMGPNLVDMINVNRVIAPEYAGVAYALFAWSWLHLADYHGPTIVKQALDANRLTFDYDEQNVAYLKAIECADSAEYYLKIALTNPESSARLAKGDAYFYNGNVDSYLRFAYGAKAKAYHRWWNKADYKPDSVIKYIDLSFTSAAQDATVKYDQNPQANDQRNFFGPARNNLATYRQTAWTIDLFKGTYWGNVVDPRLAYIFKPSADGQFRGVVPTLGQTFTGTAVTNNFWGTASTTAPTVDTSARTYFKNSVPFPIMTYAELQFIKAEAAFKKGNKALALQAYQNGIRGHFDHLKNYTGYVAFTDAQRDAYINNPAISPVNSADLTRSQIMMQKFMSLWGYGFEEAWVDLRKDKYSAAIFTGFAIPASLFPDNGGLPAYRVRPRYNSEYLWNTEALKLVGGLNVNYHTKEVWFVNP